MSAFCLHYIGHYIILSVPSTKTPFKKRLWDTCLEQGSAKNAFVSPKNAFVLGKNASASLLHTSKNQNSGKLPPGKNMMTFPEKAVSHEKAEKSDLGRSRSH